MLSGIPQLELKNQYFENGAQHLTKNSFNFLGQLGVGAFAKVYKVSSKLTGTIYALKIISKSQIAMPKLQEQLGIEISILCSCQHENIIKIFGAFEDSDYIYLIFEYANGSTLFDRLRKAGRFQEAEAARYLRQTAHALKYLHSQSPAIIHRDLKAENILIHDEKCKIADFGWSNKDQDFRNTFCGTPDYLAPEMIVGSGHNEKLDIWTLGVLMYELLHGKTPFALKEKPKDQKNVHRLIEKNIMEGKFETDPSLSAAAQDAIRKMMQTDPAKRPSIGQVLELEFFRSFDSPSNGNVANSFRDLAFLGKTAEHHNINSNKQQESSKNQLAGDFKDKHESLQARILHLESLLMEKENEIMMLTTENSRLKQQDSSPVKVYSKRYNDFSPEFDTHKKNSNPNIEIDQLKDQIEKLNQNISKQESTLGFIFQRMRDLSNYISKFYSANFGMKKPIEIASNSSINFDLLNEQLRVIFTEITAHKRPMYSPVPNKPPLSPITVRQPIRVDQQISLANKQYVGIPNPNFDAYDSNRITQHYSSNAFPFTQHIAEPTRYMSGSGNHFMPAPKKP